MASELIVISPPGERLTLQLAPGVLQSVKAPGDGYAHVVIEVAESKADESAELKGEETPPRPDLTMSVVGGLPNGIGPAKLKDVRTLTGHVTFAELAGLLAHAQAGGPKILLLGPDDVG